jgi:alanyl-tRNA synthetase
MNQFIPYFLGEEIPPYRRAVTAQKCVRVRGKHDDIDEVGRDAKHLSFFEMLGNFSFGDYFKAEMIPWAWEFLTEELGLDAERLWVTVYTDDDEAADIWADVVGVRRSRIQRTGADNFWEMGDTGPCGPCSEIHFDRGEAWGTGGGPVGGSEDRYVELWNLVFPQYDRQKGGELARLPRPGIDTGAGFERFLTVLQGVRSVWETDVLRPLIGRAEALTGLVYGDDQDADVALRVVADHARTMSFLISDGVFPSNEDRGYVLRRIIRRAVLRASSLGVQSLVCPPMVEAVVDQMAGAYPSLAKNADFVVSVAAKEEERFRANLRSGMSLLEAELAGGDLLGGETAFRLHDTHGFPIELTREIVAGRGARIDEAGFSSAMERQREQSREAGKGRVGFGHANLGAYREILEQFGPSKFLGYTNAEGEGRVLAVLEAEDAGRVEVFLDRTPFYAESGGQVGDEGTISTSTGRARVLDTTAALPGLHRHLAVLEDGFIEPGQEASASVDNERRAAIRRNHTATHLLHWALREVLGRHVKQQGSLVAPDRLRFDFTHYAPVSRAELDKVEDLVNAQVLADMGVHTEELPRAEAEAKGAIAFFGEKYGEVVRVVHAGDESVELCGGTHVERLGMIGPLEIVSESSIGSNLRRVEALTGTATLSRLRANEVRLAEVAALLRATPEELVPAVERRMADLRAAQEELREAKHGALAGEAVALASSRGPRGAVVARKDGISADALRELALAVRDQPGVQAVVLGGCPEDGKVSLVAAVRKGHEPAAPELVANAARVVGGGGGGRNPELAMAGGRDASRLDEALRGARTVLEAGG